MLSVVAKRGVMAMQKIEHASDRNENHQDHFDSKTAHAWGVCVLFYLAVIVPLWILFEIIRLLIAW